MSYENRLNAVTPVDGRYRDKVKELSNYFSEYALIRNRVRIEVEYLKFLAKNKILDISYEEMQTLTKLAEEFSLEDAEKVKAYEEETRHDVEGVVRFLKARLSSLGLGRLAPYIHIGLTSEDVNNLAYSLALREFNQKTLKPQLDVLLKQLLRISDEHKRTAMLARTHGQPAVPTTLGKEVAVHAYRILRIRKKLSYFTFPGKLSGAVGTYAGLREIMGSGCVEYAAGFVEKLGLEPWIATKQTLPHDRISEYLHALAVLASCLLDLSRDLWLMAMLGYVEKRAAGVGSSTMPHKTNPIEAENAEGNLETSITLLNFMATRLMTTRLQRDLSDSTIRRNYGTAVAHLIIAMKSLSEFLDNILFNVEKMRKDLEASSEWASEAVQIRLRLKGHDAMEDVRKLSRARGDYRWSLRQYILKLGEKPSEIIPEKPDEYLGEAEAVVEKVLQEARDNLIF